MGGVMATIVEANTTIPCSKSQIFTTAVDNQPAVTILIAQGNRPLIKDNKQIGIFNLDGIAPAKRGIPQIEVKFDIDANGILSVSAVDKGTGKEQKVTIESKGSLSDEDIERMKKDAEKYAEEDKKAKEEIEKINAADSYAFSIEKTIEEMNDKIADDKKESLKEKINSLKDAIKERNINVIEETRQTLEKEWNEVVAEIYKDTNGNDNASNPFGNFGFSGNNNPFSRM
jgi:molecular chaperone DnaK